MPTEHFGEDTPHRFEATYIARSNRFEDPTSGLSWEPGDRGPKEVDQRLADYLRSTMGGSFEVQEITEAPAASSAAANETTNEEDDADDGDSFVEEGD